MFNSVLSVVKPSEVNFSIIINCMLFNKIHP
jgi:hypothetical protein